MEASERQHRARLATERAEAARELLRACTVCPRHCGVDRLDGETGSCRIGERALVASAGPHFGEEPPLVGWGGSGTIFFSGCNLHCVFCQNHDISQQVVGREVDPGDLARMMLALQAKGCHNVNFVSPSHVAPQLLAALAIALAAGLEVPTVYNCGGYEELATLRLLDGLIDIYMPDFKYGAAGPDEQFSDAPGYPEVCRAALREMHRQVGDLELDDRGLAVRGILLRHLVLPGDLAASAEVARFVAEEISRDTYVNVMGQYRPEYRAHDHAALSRRSTAAELDRARRAFVAAGLTRFAR